MHFSGKPKYTAQKRSLTQKYEDIYTDGMLKLKIVPVGDVQKQHVEYIECIGKTIGDLAAYIAPVQKNGHDSRDTLRIVPKIEHHQGFIAKALVREGWVAVVEPGIVLAKKPSDGRFKELLRSRYEALVNLLSTNFHNDIRGKGNTRKAKEIRRIYKDKMQGITEYVEGKLKWV